MTTRYDNRTSVLITPHSAYVWHHLHYRRRHIQSITPSYNLYDFTSTSGMTSHTLYQTSHQLYLYITPTFDWYHTHCMCDIIYTIYNIISNSYVITLYLWQHKLDIWNHILYAVQNIHYPCDITVTSLCHHTTVLRAFHPLFVWHHSRHRYNIFCTIEDIISSFYEIKPPFLWNHIHYIWLRIDAISVNTSTLFMISHLMNLWDLILYICRHHIHCIQQHIHNICTITATVPVSHTHQFHDITPLYIWHCTHYMFNIRYTI